MLTAEKHLQIKQSQRTGISITKNLTVRRMEFLHKAMETFGFKNVWTVDGRTVRLDEISKKPKRYFGLSKMACCFLGKKRFQ